MARMKFNKSEFALLTYGNTVRVLDSTRWIIATVMHAPGYDHNDSLGYERCLCQLADGTDFYAYPGKVEPA